MWYLWKRKYGAGGARNFPFPLLFQTYFAGLILPHIQKLCPVILVFLKSTFRPPIFFSIIKLISPKQKLILWTALIAELLLPGEGSRPYSPFPHLEREPLFLTQDALLPPKAGQRMIKANSSSQGPFRMGISEANGRHCLLQWLLWVSLALAPLKSTRPSLALLVPKTHTSGNLSRSLWGSSRSALFHMGQSLSHPSCPTNSIPKSASSPSDHSISLQSSSLGSCSLCASWSQMNRSCFLHGLFEVPLTR